MKRLFNRWRRSPIQVAVPLWLPLLLFGSGSLSNLAPASAQQNLPEPRIFDELPPPSSFPSPSSIPTFNVPTSPSPPTLPNTVPNTTPNTVPNTPLPEREFNFQAAPESLPSRRGTPTSNLYRVDIYGDSPFLLSQVRQIEPGAFVRRGEGVIQAGIFADAYNAESRVRTLAASGIRAQVTPITGNLEASFRQPVPSLTTSSEVDLESPETLASDSIPASVTSRGYFVVIPGNSTELPNIAAEVIRLGISESAVNQKEAPRGPHVAVGPFNSRREADRWSNYLRSLGMDARVYFGN